MDVSNICDKELVVIYHLYNISVNKFKDIVAGKKKEEDLINLFSEYGSDTWFSVNDELESRGICPHELTVEKITKTYTNLLGE